jgi:outer membrane protein assembly factor BamA
VDLQDLNKSELIELIKQQTGRRISPSLSNEELIAIANTGEIKGISATESTRKRLQVFIDKNKTLYQANLPCLGQLNEGKCTIFKCSEMRHTDCWNNLKDKVNDVR